MGRGDRPAAVLLALALGGLGGALAHWADLPLAWMIGAMTATTLAAMFGLPVGMALGLRVVMVAVLGVMLGSAFTPALLQQAARWGFTLSMLALYILVAASLGYVYFRRIGGYDRPTATFAAMPGGLSEMIIMGGLMGGDSRLISLTHASRILLVVLILPFAFQFISGYSPAGRPQPGPPLMTLPAVDLGVLAACGIFGFLAARAIRLPAAAIVGPMLASAVVHLTGLSSAKPPSEIVAIAQLVVGAGIGCRFAGSSLRLVTRAIAVAAGATALLLAVTLAFSFALAWVTGIDGKALVLAFAPGGLAEMSLIALALQIDAAFVATHHSVRIFLIVVCVPSLYRRFAGRN